MPVACRCYWHVSAGLIPSEPEDPKYARRFSIDSVEWADEANRDRVFSDRAGAAHAWAQALEYRAALGHDINWVRVEFYWL